MQTPAIGVAAGFDGDTIVAVSKTQRPLGGLAACLRGRVNRRGRRIANPPQVTNLPHKDGAIYN
jgi:hypothetical protein